QRAGYPAGATTLVDHCRVLGSTGSPMAVRRGAAGRAGPLMRVIAGAARGRPLQAPKSPATRPTSDLVRGAIFSMLETRGAWFTRVLDLYAGTGAMGIEALSRGAERAVFVERDRAACAVITANLEKTGLSSNGTILQGVLPGAI